MIPPLRMIFGEVRDALKTHQHKNTQDGATKINGPDGATGANKVSKIISMLYFFHEPSYFFFLLEAQRCHLMREVFGALKPHTHMRTQDGQTKKYEVHMDGLDETKGQNNHQMSVFFADPPISHPMVNRLTLRAFIFFFFFTAPRQTSTIAYPAKRVAPCAPRACDSSVFF